jgi:hypothetical protein
MEPATVREMRWAGAPAMCPSAPTGGASGRTIRRRIGRTICGTGRVGEICIELGETTFYVDNLRIRLTSLWMRANAVRSARDASHQKT